MEIDGLIDDEEDFQPRSVRPRTTRSLQIPDDSESDDASVDNGPNPNTDTDDASDSDGQPGKRKRKRKKSAKGIQKQTKIQKPKSEIFHAGTKRVVSEEAKQKRAEASLQRKSAKQKVICLTDHPSR